MSSDAAEVPLSAAAAEAEAAAAVAETEATATAEADAAAEAAAIAAAQEELILDPAGVMVDPSAGLAAEVVEIDPNAVPVEVPVVTEAEVETLGELLATPDVLDPALLRPGRFDRQVTVSLPDVKGRDAPKTARGADYPNCPAKNPSGPSTSTSRLPSICQNRVPTLRTNCRSWLTSRMVPG